MGKDELIKKIILKKEFSQLPERDVLLAFKNFDKEKYSDEEKVKLTRNLLRKVFSSFASRKLLSFKDKNEEWFLKKHLSTKERFLDYEKIYLRIFNGMGKDLSVIDLGAGVNGFSYNYFKKVGFNINYTAIEAVGQFVELMNRYFKIKKIRGNSIHLSLFELEKIKEVLKKTKKPRIVFLFKTIDSLEMLRRDYSKELILGISLLCDKIVLSFPTRSMIKRKKFIVRRNWIVDFITLNFEVLDIFEFGDEKYFVFRTKN